jgi:hypothetical protein
MFSVGEDGTYQVVGMIMEAQDLASGVVTKADENIAAATENIEANLTQVVGVVDQSTADFSNAFNDLGKDVRTALDFTALDVASEALDKVVMGVTTATLAVTTLATVGFVKLGAAAASTTVQLGGMLGKLLGIGQAGEGPQLGKKFFDLTMVGPLGKILSLLSPIIDAITDVMMPAFETLGALVKNSLAPLGFIFEAMAQQLAPLIQKAIAPFVSLLELGAAQLGAFLAKMLDTNGAIGPLAQLFTSLQGPITRIMGALTNVGMKLLPIVFRLIEQLVPVVSEVATLFADHLAVVLEEIVNTVITVAPELTTVFVDLLKAILPILPPLLRLAQVLIKDVFSPLLIATVSKFAPLLRDHVIPWVQALSTVVGDAVEWIADRLTTFRTHFNKYVEDFYTLFLMPIEEGVTKIINLFKFEGVLAGVQALFVGMSDMVMGIWNTLIAFIGESLSDVMEMLGFKEAGEKARNLFQTLADMVMLPVKILREFMAGNLIEGIINPMLRWQPLSMFGVQSSVGQILGVGALNMPKLAQGGVVTDPTVAMVGEGADDEIVLPLRKDVLEKVLEPVIPEMALPGLEEATQWLAKIHAALTGTLTVRTAQRFVGGDDSRAEDDDLTAAVGLGGMAR